MFVTEETSTSRTMTTIANDSSNNFIYSNSMDDIEDLKRLQEHLNRTSLAVMRIFDPLIAIFGIIGNLISIAVLTRRWMRSSTNYYLTALAVYDTLYLIFAATMTVSDYDEIGSRTWYKSYQFPVGKPLVDIFSNTGVWLTLTFTIERWLCVCHPMRGRVWCTPKRAKYIIIFVCIAAGLITFPEFFEFRLPCTPTNETCSMKVERSHFAQTSAYTYGYVNINQVLFTFMPLVLLCIFNFLLIRAVVRANQKRKAMLECRQSTNLSNGRTERQQKEQQRVTITLISVVLVFLICHTPQAIQNIYTYMTPPVKPTSEHLKLRITANIFNMLVMLNASINFVLYSTFNTKFRHTFKRISLRTYRRLQGRPVHDPTRFYGDGSYTSSPYRDQVTNSTKITKFRSTEENLHKCLVAKSDYHVERCGVVSAQTSPIPMIKVSGTLNGGHYFLTPTCDRSPADSERSFV